MTKRVRRHARQFSKLDGFRPYPLCAYVEFVASFSWEEIWRLAVCWHRPQKFQSSRAQRSDRLALLAVNQSDAATREISVNAQSAADGNHTLVANIASLRDAIGETNTAAASVLSASGELTSTADTLSREVEKFFRSLRAGSAKQSKVA